MNGVRYFLKVCIKTGSAEFVVRFEKFDSLIVRSSEEKDGFSNPVKKRVLESCSTVLVYFSL